MATSVIVLAIAILAIGSLIWFSSQERNTLRNLIETMRSDHRAERINWERERERLLNRAMTREWTSYLQMLPTMENSGSTSEESKGMSDEEEMRRAGFSDPQGFGEVVVDMTDEMRMLGLD
jgi:hypothetical protein